MCIVSYSPIYREALLDISLRAWGSVFPRMHNDVPEFVYDAFYPQGWQQRQLSDLKEVFDQEPQNVSVAIEGEHPVAWVCTRIHPEDQMGEIYVIAVDPEYQRCGVGQRLMDHASAQIKDAGMRMVMVETGGDSGHAPARALYESEGFVRWPVARYFKDLSE